MKWKESSILQKILNKKLFGSISELELKYSHIIFFDLLLAFLYIGST